MGKWIADNDNEDLLGEYLAEDPAGLSKLELKKAADLFGLSFEEVVNIAKGMSEARREVAAQFKDGELTASGSVVNFT